MVCCDPILTIPNSVTQVAEMPYPLYLSLQGKYFVGYADEMEFDGSAYAWAGLVNPIHSGVNLFVYVWTATNTGRAPLETAVWFNADPPGEPVQSELVTPGNTALFPLPQPKVRLLKANNVEGAPSGGMRIYGKTVDPEITVAEDENGALIFPPGGSLIITMSSAANADRPGAGRVAFGWAEEKIRP